MDNRYSRHNKHKYSLKVHIVFVTKYRKQLLKETITDDVKQQIFDICNSNGWDIIAMETNNDHIHFLIRYDATNRVYDIVKTIKQQTIYVYYLKYLSINTDFSAINFFLWSCASNLNLSTLFSYISHYAK